MFLYPKKTSSSMLGDMGDMHGELHLGWVVPWERKVRGGKRGEKRKPNIENTLPVQKSYCMILTRRGERNSESPGPEIHCSLKQRLETRNEPLVHSL